MPPGAVPDPSPRAGGVAGGVGGSLAQPGRVAPSAARCGVVPSGVLR